MKKSKFSQKKEIYQKDYQLKLKNYQLRNKLLEQFSTNLHQRFDVESLVQLFL